MKKVLSVIVAVIILTVAFCLTFNVFADEPKNGFVRENGAVYYYTNGELDGGRWVDWNGNKYYVDWDGKVVANRVYEVYDSNTNSYSSYFFDSKGVMQKGGFVKKVESYDDWSYTYYYYAYANGKLAQGWTKIGDYTYYFNDASWNPYMYCDGIQYVGSTPYLFTKGGILKQGGGWISYTRTYDDGSKYTEYYYSTAKGAIYTGWKTIGDYKYYLYPARATGVQEIDGKSYYFTNKGILKTGGFIKHVESYDYEDGTHYTNTVYFYAKKNGELLKGWQTIGDNKYYFEDSAWWPRMFTGVNEINGKSYYFTSGGVLKTGWIKHVEKGDGWTYTEYYCATKTGILLKGWQTIGGKKYYFADNSWNPYMYRNGLRTIGKYEYLFSPKGVLLAGGLQKITYEGDGYSKGYTDYFYTNKYGIPYTGWKTINGKQYYFNPYMVKSSGYKVKNKVYLFGNNGVRITKAGWNKITETYTNSDGSKDTYTDYYYLSGGVCKTGWQKINGNYYYFDDNYGHMYKNGGYRITKNDVTRAYVFEANGTLTKRTGWIALKSSDGKHTYKFFVVKNGIAKTGFKQYKGNYYYFDDYGYMSTGITTIYGKDDSHKTYFFKDNGVWVKNKAGWVKETYGDGYADYYYFVNGVAKVGWKVINGNSYCFDEYGRMYKGGTYYINGKEYTFRANGTLVK